MGSLPAYMSVYHVNVMTEQWSEEDTISAMTGVTEVVSYPCEC